MRPRVTLRIAKGGTSAGVHEIRVGGKTVGTVEPRQDGGWNWVALSTELEIPLRYVKHALFFHVAKAEALAYVRECLAKKEGAS